MAQNISQIDSTFQTVLIPPFFETASYELAQEWGSRIAVHSGRARGLYGLGTVSAEGTTIDFPVGYFNTIPITDVMIYRPPYDAGYFEPVAEGTLTKWFFTPLLDYWIVGSTSLFISPGTATIIGWRAYGV
jgi:hypothetical protein